MRKIKFRAWDTGRKEYLSGGGLFIGIKPGQTPPDNAIYLDLLKDPDKYKDRFILEQSIDHCDEYNTEIFEGDIISFEDVSSKGDTNLQSINFKEMNAFRNQAVVVWKDGRFQLDHFSKKDSMAFKILDSYGLPFWEILPNCRITGNIHKDKLSLDI